MKLLKEKTPPNEPHDYYIMNDSIDNLADSIVATLGNKLRYACHDERIILSIAALKQVLKGLEDIEAKEDNLLTLKTL